MSNIEVVYDPDESVTGYVDEDINEGIAASSKNYLKPNYTTTKSQAATSFKLTMDNRCSDQRRRDSQDLSKGAYVHPDCRYLDLATTTFSLQVPSGVNSYDSFHLKKPITHIFVSRNGRTPSGFNTTGTVQCTRDINAGRYHTSSNSYDSDSLQLCWENREGNLISYVVDMAIINKCRANIMMLLKA